MSSGDDNFSDDSVEFGNSDHDTWTDGLLSRLSYHSRRLSRLSQLIVLVTMLNFTSFTLQGAIAATGARNFYSIDLHIARVTTIFVQIILTFTVLYLLFAFESLRRRSGALFEALSDTFQEMNSLGVPHELKLRFTLTLREFSASDTLPIVSTRQDVPIYAAFSMLVMVLSIVVSSLSGSGGGSSGTW